MGASVGIFALPQLINTRSRQPLIRSERRRPRASSNLTDSPSFHTFSCSSNSPHLHDPRRHVIRVQDLGKSLQVGPLFISSRHAESTEKRIFTPIVVFRQQQTHLSSTIISTIADSLPQNTLIVVWTEGSRHVRHTRLYGIQLVKLTASESV